MTEVAAEETVKTLLYEDAPRVRFGRQVTQAGQEETESVGRVIAPAIAGRGVTGDEAAKVLLAGGTRWNG